MSMIDIRKRADYQAGRKTAYKKENDG